MTSAAFKTSHQQSGFSLIDIMVGLIIGMIAVLVIYQVFAASEGIKRNTTSAGDAQQNGLLSSFIMTVELANAANGLAASQQDLMKCTPSPDVASFASSWHPIPVLVSDGGGAATNPNPDQFIVTYSTANRIVGPAPFMATAGAGDYFVQSAQGFKLNDLVVAIASDGTCLASRVTANPAAADSLGRIHVTNTGTSTHFDATSVLFNMGPTTTAQRARYDIFGETLRGTSLLTADGAADPAPSPNPIASNIVMMKVQYGIDTNNDRLLDAWVSATGPWADTALLNANAATLNQIKAIRIGIVAKGEQFDLDLAKKDDALPGRIGWSLFGGTFTGAAERGMRYRPYEMIVPLRNSIWNS